MVSARRVALAVAVFSIKAVAVRKVSKVGVKALRQAYASRESFSDQSPKFPAHTVPSKHNTTVSDAALTQALKQPRSGSEPVRQAKEVAKSMTLEPKDVLPLAAALEQSDSRKSLQRLPQAKSFVQLSSETLAQKLTGMRNRVRTIATASLAVFARDYFGGVAFALLVLVVIAILGVACIMMVAQYEEVEQERAFEAEEDEEAQPLSLEEEEAAIFNTLARRLEGKIQKLPQNQMTSVFKRYFLNQSSSIRPALQDRYSAVVCPERGAQWAASRLAWWESEVHFRKKQSPLNSLYVKSIYEVGDEMYYECQCVCVYHTGAESINEKLLLFFENADDADDFKDALRSLVTRVKELSLQSHLGAIASKSGATTSKWFRASTFPSAAAHFQKSESSSDEEVPRQAHSTSWSAGVKMKS